LEVGHLRIARSVSLVKLVVLIDVYHQIGQRNTLNPNLDAVDVAIGPNTCKGQASKVRIPQVLPEQILRRELVHDLGQLALGCELVDAIPVEPKGVHGRVLQNLERTEREVRSGRSFVGSRVDTANRSPVTCNENHSTWKAVT